MRALALASILLAVTPATADYTVKITHPLLAKATVLHMHREEKADVKRVDWDKQ